VIIPIIPCRANYSIKESQKMQQRKMKIAKFLVAYDKQQTWGMQKEGLSALPCF
jgi:hypothetical protein